MEKNPKFMVLHIRELIYTAVFILLGIVLIFSLVIMFSNNSDSDGAAANPESSYLENVTPDNNTMNDNSVNMETEEATSIITAGPDTTKYEPGVYTSCITLNGNAMDITVTLDSDHINAITIDNISDSIATMYPLVQPAFEDIANQIVNTQSLENIQFDQDCQYTYTLLYDAISDIINQHVEK